MHGTVAVHTCDTEIQHWLKTLFLAAFTILLCGDCLATLASRPSTGNHYVTPAAIQKYIENGITTREPPSNEPVYFKFHFTHYIDFSYNNIVQTNILKRMVLHILIITDIKCFTILNYVCQKDSYIIPRVWNDCPGRLTLQCEIEKQAFPSRTHKASLPLLSFVVVHICNYYCCFDFILWKIYYLSTYFAHVKCVDIYPNFRKAVTFVIFG